MNQKEKRMEENLLRNIAMKTLKIDLHSHVPYSDVYRALEREIESRELMVKHLKVGTSLPLIGSEVRSDTECYLCGAKIGYLIKDEENVEAYQFSYQKGFKIQNDGHETCEFANKKKQIHKYDLTFSTGTVMVDNFFGDASGEGYLFELPKDEKWDDKFSLQTLKGRFNRMDYLSQTHNMGYAQMGNMSVEVFVSKDKKKIIIGSEPAERTNKKDEEFNKKFKAEYKRIGYISLSVWRWECADKQVLLDKGHSGEADVTAKVIPGVYTVTHYYDSLSFKENYGRYQIYSEITLKEPIK